jgi:magnesium transporter
MLDTMTGATEAELAILVRAPDGTVRTLPAERIDEIDRLVATHGTILWVHAHRPDDETLTRLGAEFGVHDLALEDLRKQNQRPKLDTYEEQHHLVAYEASPTAPNKLAELQLLVGPHWVLSVHWQPTPMVDAAQRRVAAGHDALSGTAAGLVYLILDAATDSFFPELDHLSERIDAIEDQVIEGSTEAGTLREILALKRLLLEQRRVLGPMRDVANALLRSDVAGIGREMVPYYQDLYDHLVRVLDQLDLYRDLLAAVLDARMSSVSNDLNATVRRLTALTVVIMVPTLIAGIYGMNFTFMPELGWPLGYPFALGLMLLAAVAAVVYFRRQRWF